jgi:Sec-independent protein translocase protein TatA
MPTDLVLVLVVILVLAVLWRGPKTLPQLGEALGRGIREVRRGASGDPAHKPGPSEDDPEQRS